MKILQFNQIFEWKENKAGINYCLVKIWVNLIGFLEYSEKIILGRTKVRALSTYIEANLPLRKQEY